MRLPSLATTVLAVLAASVAAEACGDTGEHAVAGAGLAAREAPRRGTSLHGAPHLDGLRRGTARLARFRQDTLPRIRRPSRQESEELRLRLPPADEPPGDHALYWTRAVYTGGRRGWWGGRSAWSTDFPKGDRQFLVVLDRLVRVDAYDFENAVSLADPGLRRFPLLYAVEVGQMELTPEEVRGLRDYLTAGGLLIVDDFWGTREWAQFEYNMRKVLPGRPIQELPPDHPLFSTYYQIDSIVQVPNVRNARAITLGYRGAGTWERDGYVPHVRGIFDDDGELMVLINWNTDLGDAWEWAEDPMYPLEYSTYAFEMGANMVVYGMSH